MPWISAQVWDKMREDLNHRVTTDAGIVNRLVRLDEAYKQLSEDVKRIAAALPKPEAQPKVRKKR